MRPEGVLKHLNILVNKLVLKLIAIDFKDF